MNKYLRRENIYRLVSILAGLLIALLAAEIGLRIIFPEPQEFYVWRPNLQRNFNPSPGVMPGITGNSRFYINSEGIRGDEFSEEQEYRILAIGGSTTECAYLDQTEAWPYLLQERLNSLELYDVWVGNVGKSDRNTNHHILQMEYLLPQYPRIDAIVMLVGACERLRGDVTHEELLDHAFSAHPYGSQSFPQNMAIWRLSRKLMRPRANWDILFPVQSAVIMEHTGKWYTAAREHRKSAEIVDGLPDLTPLLEEYERNLNTIIDMAESKSVRLIFLAQPAMYRPDLTQQEKDLLWGGAADRSLGKYYSVSEMLAREEQRNSKLIEVCQLRGVEYIDLANRLPKDVTVFYDDYHFNENGSRMVADVIFEYLSQREPFVESGEEPLIRGFHSQSPKLQRSP